jgi:hypothetical protein
MFDCLLRSPTLSLTGGLIGPNSTGGNRSTWHFANTAALEVAGTTVLDVVR